MLTGQYSQGTYQINYDLGIYAQINVTAMRAWHLLPLKGGCQADLTKIIQIGEESYSYFVNHILGAATQVFSDTQVAMPFIQKLA